ncbi:hypothetical protein J7643_17390 [bacterium]|nr:hypothetical protein [bacterium]
MSRRKVLSLILVTLTLSGLTVGCGRVPTSSDDDTSNKPRPMRPRVADTAR